MSATISQAYILGISEGRSLLKANPDFTRADILDILDGIQRTLELGFASDVRDMLRGGRDFWRHQLEEGLHNANGDN